MASTMALEGVVVDGAIRLPAGVRLRERARVYVVIPAEDAVATVSIPSPRLADRAQAAEFAMQVTEAPPDADVRRGSV